MQQEVAKGIVEREGVLLAKAMRDLHGVRFDVVMGRDCGSLRFSLVNAIEYSNQTMGENGTRIDHHVAAGVEHLVTRAQTWTDLAWNLKSLSSTLELGRALAVKTSRSYRRAPSETSMAYRGFYDMLRKDGFIYSYDNGELLFLDGDEINHIPLLWYAERYSAAGTHIGSLSDPGAALYHILSAYLDDNDKQGGAVVIGNVVRGLPPGPAARIEAPTCLINGSYSDVVVCGGWHKPGDYEMRMGDLYVEEVRALCRRSLLQRNGIQLAALEYQSGEALLVAIDTQGWPLELCGYSEDDFMSRDVMGLARDAGIGNRAPVSVTDVTYDTDALSHFDVDYDKLPVMAHEEGGFAIVGNPDATRLSQKATPSKQRRGA